jgi:DNA-binding response OmpR family regulator
LPISHLVLKSGRRIAEEAAMTDSPKVLVADDEPHLLRLVKFRLEREGYQVVTAPDGQAALELARTEQPDLCVLDVMMPKRSGFDVLRELRSDSECAHMKVIMLTARAQDRDVDAGFSLGADDYITKPFSPQELRVRIGAHLAKR